jgi:hypothetical protein
MGGDGETASVPNIARTSRGHLRHRHQASDGSANASKRAGRGSECVWQRICAFDVSDDSDVVLWWFPRGGTIGASACTASISGWCIALRHIVRSPGRRLQLRSRGASRCWRALSIMQGPRAALRTSSCLFLSQGTEPFASTPVGLRNMHHPCIKHDSLEETPSTATARYGGAATTQTQTCTLGWVVAACLSTTLSSVLQYSTHSQARLANRCETCSKPGPNHKAMARDPCA